METVIEVRVVKKTAENTKLWFRSTIGVLPRYYMAGRR